MGVRLKVDEDLPRQIAEMWRQDGHDAVTVLEQGWEGAPDDALWRHVQAEGRWFMTADKAFADLRKYPPGSHAGVILLRSAEENRRSYVDLATVALRRLKLDKIACAVAVVTHRGIRIRRAPKTQMSQGE